MTKSLSRGNAKYMLLAVIIITAIPQTVFSRDGELLVCRGGGDMNIFFSAYKGDGYATKRRAIITMYVAFKKNPYVYNSRRLQPGQCAWKNRQFKFNEPNELIMIGRYTKMIMSFFIQKKRPSNHKSSNKSNFEKIIRDIQESKTFYLRVKPQKHNNKNYLGISSYGSK